MALRAKQELKSYTVMLVELLYTPPAARSFGFASLFSLVTFPVQELEGE